MKSAFICLIWVAEYSVLCCLLTFFKASSDFVTASTVFYWFLLFLHLRKRKLLSEYGFRLSRLHRARSAGALLIIPILQCLLYGLPIFSVKERLVILLATLAEEVGFRILLPKIMAEYIHCSVKKSIFISSIAFGLFHGVNLLSGAAVPYVLLQMLYAFFAGLAFCAMVQKTKSVLPSVILHTLINWTAGSQIVGATIIFPTLAFSALFAGYAIIIFHNTQKGSTYL